MSENTPTLADLPRLGTARVSHVEGADAVADRLRELGLCCGTPVQFVRQAPFGGPLVLELRGYHLCLRPTEARRVRVEVSPT